MSGARGLLAADGRTDNIRNRPLEAVGHVTRVVFRQVYALTLAELAGLEGESWALVQDRLVGAMGVKDLRPARLVAAEFEKGANRLWRPDNRGRPRVRVLRAELADLNERRRQALRADGLLRTTAGERAEAEKELAELRGEREREGERSERLEHRLNRLLPVRGALARIAELRSDAGSTEALKALPDNPPGHLETLRNRRLEAGVKTEECDREAALCQETLDEYQERYRKVAEAEGRRARDAAARMVAMAGMRKDLDSAAREVAELEAALRRAGRRGLRGAVGPRSPRATTPPFRTANCASGCWRIRRRARGCWRNSRARAARTAGGCRRPPGRGGARWPPASPLLAGGLGLGTWPVFFQDLVLQVPGGTQVSASVALVAALFLAGGGLITVIVRADRKRRHSQYRSAVAEAEERRKARIALLTDREVEAREGVHALVGTLPVAGRPPRGAGTRTGRRSREVWRAGRAPAEAQRRAEAAPKGDRRGPGRKSPGCARRWPFIRAAKRRWRHVCSARCWLRR